MTIKNKIHVSAFVAVPRISAKTAPVAVHMSDQQWAS